MDDRPTPAASLTIGDVAHVEAAIPGINVARLDRGRGETELTLARLGGTDLCVGRFDCKISSEGGIGDDDFRLGLQLDEGIGSWNGSAFDLDRLWVYRPGAEHAGATGLHGANRGATWATFTLPVEAVERAGGWQLAAHTGGLSVMNTLTGRLRATIADVTAAVKGHTLSDEQARRAGRELRDTSLGILFDAENVTLEALSAYRITRRCLHVADELGPMPTTAELAVALDVSDRWVRAAFRRVYGVSVSAFFRARGLHRAHRALISADPTSTSVTEVATACGFWHLGRFSGYYLAHFAEYPRTTLLRSP